LNREHLFFEQEIIRKSEECETENYLKSDFYVVLKNLSPQIERKYFTVLKFANYFGIHYKLMDNF
jgi:hypothetical protein